MSPQGCRSHCCCCFCHSDSLTELERTFSCNQRRKSDPLSHPSQRAADIRPHAAHSGVISRCSDCSCSLHRGTISPRSEQNPLTRLYPAASPSLLFYLQQPLKHLKAAPSGSECKEQSLSRGLKRKVYSSERVL